VLVAGRVSWPVVRPTVGGEVVAVVIALVGVKLVPGVAGDVEGVGGTENSHVGGADVVGVAGAGILVETVVVGVVGNVVVVAGVVYVGVVAAVGVVAVEVAEVVGVAGVVAVVAFVVFVAFVEVVEAVVGGREPPLFLSPFLVREHSQGEWGCSQKGKEWGLWQVYLWQQWQSMEAWQGP